MRTILLGPALALCLALPVAAHAAEDGGWQGDLVVQLAEEEDCKLAFYSRISVIVQNGTEIVSARAHCEDGRAFDAARISPEKRFDLRACASAQERTC